VLPRCPVHVIEFLILFKYQLLKYISKGVREYILWIKRLRASVKIANKRSRKSPTCITFALFRSSTILVLSYGYVSEKTTWIKTSSINYVFISHLPRTFYATHPCPPYDSTALISYQQHIPRRLSIHQISAILCPLDTDDFNNTSHIHSYVIRTKCFGFLNAAFKSILHVSCH